MMKTTRRLLCGVLFATFISGVSWAQDQDPEDIEAQNERGLSSREAFDLGLAAMEAEDYAEAVSQFNAAAEADPTQHLIFANLGLAYERSEMWAEAVEAYNEAQTLLETMEEPPGGVNYFPNLTLAYTMVGNGDLALQNAEKGAEVDPEGAAQSFYNIGAILTNRGDLEGAAQAFERAIEVDPDAAEPYYQLALARFGNEATIPDAIPLLERYLELTLEGPNVEAAQGLLDFARQSQ